jgi:Holliday junction resolvasome RuvABC endonuclease subunit
MKTDLPGPAPPGFLHDHLTRLVEQLHKYLTRAVDQTEAIDTLYMRSPNKSVYRVTIADDGTIVRTHVQGGP